MYKIDYSITNRMTIKNGELTVVLPELYELKGVIENNAWHNRESIFDHTLFVLDNAARIIQKFVAVKSILSEAIGQNSRGLLLRMAILLHDIGKKETMAQIGDKRCTPGHETASARKAEKILERFDFSAAERERIIKIIKNHGVMHDIVGIGSKEFRNDLRKEKTLSHAVDNLAAKSFEQEITKLRKKMSDIWLEQIIMNYSDTLGGYLRKTKPAEYDHRINFYKNELTAYAGSH